MKLLARPAERTSNRVVKDLAYDADKSNLEGLLRVGLTNGNIGVLW